MRTALRSLRAALKHWNDRIARGAVHVLAFPLWFTALLVGIPTWLLVDFFSHGRVDPNLVTLVAILTVQTSLDSAASNYSLRMSRAADEARMAEIAGLTVAIKSELDRSRERDEAAQVRDEQGSLRDSVLIGLVRELIALVQSLMKRLSESTHD